MRVGISGIPGNVEEIAVVDQFESRRLISDVTSASSERCRVWTTLVPAPGLAE
jgi:hypothetical protein